MEMELNSLIDKIKKDGVDEAQKNAKGIIGEAQGKAKKIIKDAEKQASAIITNAQSQAEDFKKASEKAINQSARDVLLVLRERVFEFFAKVVRQDVKEQLSPDALKGIILKAIENFRKDGISDIDILVSEKDRAKLQSLLFNALTKETKAHLTITGSPGIDKGFRIGQKGKDSYFDFTDEAITEAFKKYLSPKLVDMLEIDVGMEKGNG